jgi:hypothetical protein
MNAAIMSGLGSISDIAKQISAKKEQSDYRAGANVGDPFFKPGVERIKPPQRTDSASYGPGTPSQTFSKKSCAKGEDMYGSQEQRAMSMPNRGNIEGPLAMEDLSGDGKITQKDVGIGQGWIKPDDK